MLCTRTSSTSSTTCTGALCALCVQCVLQCMLQCVRGKLSASWLRERRCPTLAAGCAQQLLQCCQSAVQQLLQCTAAFVWTAARLHCNKLASTESLLCALQLLPPTHMRLPCCSAGIREARETGTQTSLRTLRNFTLSFWTFFPCVWVLVQVRFGRQPALRDCCVLHLLCLPRCCSGLVQQHAVLQGAGMRACQFGCASQFAWRTATCRTFPR